MRREETFVDAISPASGNVVSMQIDAYEHVWKPMGWKLAGGQAVVGESSELEVETKARLLEIAAGRGIDVAGSATKAEVLDALKGEDS